MACYINTATRLHAWNAHDLPFLLSLWRVASSLLSGLTPTILDVIHTVRLRASSGKLNRILVGFDKPTRYIM